MPEGLHIAIDGTQCMFPPLRGAARYASNLIRHLLRMPDSNYKVSVFFNTFRPPVQGLPFSEDPSATLRLSRLPGRILTSWWRNLSFPAIDLFIGAHDIFHAPSIHLIPPSRGKLVCTVHDLVPMKFPEYCTASYCKEFRKALDVIRHRADGVISVSESTKKDLIELVGYKAENIFVISEASGFDPNEAKSLKKDDEILRSHGLKIPYLLYTGGGEPHKNIRTLIKVFSILKKEDRISHQLALVGNILGVNHDLINFIMKNDLNNNIIITGVIPDEDLAVIYRNAEVFIFLSLYEGFGLVLVEAMECGIPIVASNTSSIPEVVGDAAILVDPLNIRDIREAILGILGDKSLAHTLRMKGIARSHRYSWDIVVNQTLNLYEQLLNK